MLQSECDLLFFPKHDSNIFIVWSCFGFRYLYIFSFCFIHLKNMVDDFNRGISLSPHLVKSWIHTRTWAACCSQALWKVGTQRLLGCTEEQQMRNNVTAGFCLSLVFAWDSIYTWHERAIYRKLRKELSSTIRTESPRMSVKGHYSAVIR